MDKVLSESKAYEEELREGEIVNKSKGSNRKVASKQSETIDTVDKDWETIQRLSQSFCSIIEVPSLASKLDEHTFRELVKSQLVLFNCINERYWKHEGDNE